MKNKNRIYFDYAAGSPENPNPSGLYQEAQGAKEILEDARVRVARILNCRANEIFFTSGATEALNIAILGIAKRKIQRLPHIITSTIEHSAILGPVKALIKAGEAEASFINPDENGKVSPESIKKEIKENTVLICLAHANSEIGVIQPVRKIKEVIENYKLKIENSSKLCFLVDASQSALYENVSIERLGADILILDGAKMYGPRGGILAVKRGVEIAPIMFGGGQEGGLRPGTEDAVTAAGLALALEKAAKNREKESARLKQLRDYAVKKILSEVPGSSLNGSLENRLPNNLNICFSHYAKTPRDESNKLDSEFLVIKLDTLGFAVSAASACQNISSENSSYVLEAIGKKECAGSSLRITLGRGTKKKDLDEFIAALAKIVK